MPRVLAALLLCLIIDPVCLAQSSHSYVLPESIRAAVEKEKLWESPTWRALLHYKRTLPFYQRSSLVDDPGFFFAKKGKTNPKEELFATLEAILTKQLSKGGQFAHCAFPARVFWLQTMLGAAAQAFPNDPCPRYQDWIDAFNPHSAALVFPQAFLNSPASAFGHTLLRIDPPHAESELLSYAVTFAAQTSGENAISYALKGLAGGYYGYFSVLPYYKKVNQYSAIENRDIWTYRLNIDPQTVRFLVMHVWELLGMGFRYFYFDENCAYHLLSLFDLARPSQGFTDPYYFWTLPVDTVRSINEVDGLVAEKNYRPSPNTALIELLKNADHKTIESAKHLAEDPAAPIEVSGLDLKDQALTLDLAYQIIRYRNYRKRQIPDSDKARMFELLQARSRVEWQGQTLADFQPGATPDQGHGAARVGIAAGYDSFESKRPYLEYEFRPVYHDLLDSSLGYVQGSQIEFLRSSFRHYRSDSFRFEELEALNIVSLAARNDLVKPRSWKISVGAKRIPVSSSEKKVAMRSTFAMGQTKEVLKQNVFLLGGAGLDSSRYLSSAYRLGGSIELGVSGSLTSKANYLLSGGVTRYMVGDQDTALMGKVGTSIPLADNYALRIEYSHQRDFNRSWYEFQTAFQYYF